MVSKCDDKNCPKHGKIRTHGFSFIGKVVSAKARKTISVEWTRVEDSEKYQRKYEERSRVQVHNPECIEAKKGDLVKIKETRPISKTKSFVVTEVLNKD